MLKALMLALGTLATTTIVAAPKSSDTADGNACVFFRTVHDFRALDRNKLVIWAPSRRTPYLVEVGMPLLDLTWANRLAFVDTNQDGRLCGFGMDRIVVGDTSFPQWSTITSMKPLDEPGLEQLEQQYDVKLMRKRKAPEQPQQ